MDYNQQSNIAQADWRSDLKNRKTRVSFIQLSIIQVLLVSM